VGDSNENGYTQGVSHISFWNNSELDDWVIEYMNSGIQPGDELIVPYNTVNWTSWSDFSAGLNFSNYTRDVLVDQATVDSVFISSPDVFFGL